MTNELEALKILIVDLSSLFRMAWEAAQGKEMSEAFNRTIDAVTRARVGVNRVVIACDAGPSFRRGVDPAYKANRQDPGESYREQLRRTIDRLRCDACVILAAPRVGSFSLNGQVHAPSYAEADDVIGWVAAQYLAHTAKLSEDARAGWWLTILSGDGDLEQLVDDENGIDVLKPPSLGGELWDEAKVLAKRGVAPALIADKKALAGDASDNFKPFPGITDPATGKRGPGIGDGAAVKLIQLFGGALAVFDDLDRKGDDGEAIIKPHVRKLLDMHGRDAAVRGLELARLKTTLTLDWSTIMAEPKHTPIIPDADFETPIEGDVVSPSPIVQPAPPAAAAPAPAPVAPPVAAEPAKPAPPAAPAASTALAKLPDEPATGISIYGIQPQNMAQLYRFSQMIVNSGAYPQFGKPETAMAAIADAMERGVPAMAALRATYIVKGRMAHSAAYIAALVLRSGKAAVFEIVESTALAATLAYQRVGRPERQFTFTLDEAKAAGWLKSGSGGDGKWITNPRTMLRWAAIREAARAFFPDVVSGMYTPDEIGGGVVDADLDADFVAA